MTAPVDTFRLMIALGVLVHTQGLDGRVYVEVDLKGRASINVPPAVGSEAERVALVDRLAFLLGAQAETSWHHHHALGRLNGHEVHVFTGITPASTSDARLVLDPAVA